MRIDDEAVEVSLNDRAKNVVKALKTCFYDIATVFVDIKRQKFIDGLKYKDFCSANAKIEHSFVDFCIKLMEKLPEEQAFEYTIKQLRDIAKDKKQEEKTTHRYLTIKLNTDQEKVFKEALKKFCIEHGIAEENASSFFVETRCAEYLAEVHESDREED